jgi:methionyl aminopeptidase
MFGRESIEYKTLDQIRLMRRSGLVVADALDAVRRGLRPGVTTAELDRLAEEVIRSAGAVPSFLGYGGFPASVCVSVNEEIVHGIPGTRRLKATDVISVDCGAVLDGWHADAAFTAIVPGAEPDPGDVELVRQTRWALWRGIAAVTTGARLSAVGAAVEDHVADRFGIVRGYGGHGIGTTLHQDPSVLNYRTRDRGPRLRPGICLAIEPMLVAGSPRTVTLADGWTVATRNGARSAHWEHTVALTSEGLWVLTAPDGGAEELASLGAPAFPGAGGDG